MWKSRTSEGKTTMVSSSIASTLSATRRVCCFMDAAVYRILTPEIVNQLLKILTDCVGYIHEKAGQCQVFCVNLSPSFRRLGYPRFSPCPTALLSGGYTRGRQPSCGGSRQHRCMLACFLLAGSVLPAWGERAPPRLALGGNGLPTICQVFFEGLVPFRVASKRGKP